MSRRGGPEPAPEPDYRRRRGRAAAWRKVSGIYREKFGPQLRENVETAAKLRASSTDFKVWFRADEIEECHRRFAVWVDREQPGDAREFPLSCRDRLCAVCARIKAHEWTRRLREYRRIAEDAGYTCRLVTLTTKRDSRAGLETAVGRVLAAFKKLRRRVAWKRRTHGYVAAVEVTFEPWSGYHAHIHVFHAGRFLPREELRRDWLQITGDSFVIDIRALRKGGEREIAKYCTKVADLSGDELLDWATTMRGRRLIWTGGRFYAAQRAEREGKAEPVGEVVTWGELCRLAESGEAWARSAVRAVCRRALRASPQLSVDWFVDGVPPPGST